MMMMLCHVRMLGPCSVAESENGGSAAVTPSPPPPPPHPFLLGPCYFESRMTSMHDVDGNRLGIEREWRHDTDAIVVRSEKEWGRGAALLWDQLAKLPSPDGVNPPPYIPNPAPSNSKKTKPQTLNLNSEP